MMIGSWGTQKPPEGSQVNRGHPLARGLDAYWLMNEGGGRVLRDIAGNYTGTGRSTSARGVGRYGRHTKFSNAPNDNYDTTYTKALNDFTVLAWFYGDSTCVATARILDKVYTTGFWLGRNNTSTSNLWTAGCLQSSLPYGTQVTLSDNQWHMFGQSRSGTQQTVIGDGQNLATATVGSTALSPASLSIGGVISGGGTPLTGAISQVIVWSRALVASEYLSLYNNPYAMIAPPAATKFYSYAAAVATGNRRRRILCAGRTM